MRRILSELANYLGTLATTARRGWNAFFFTPADPTPLGLIRVVVGLLALWSLIVLGLDLHDYFGSGGWADPSVIWQTQRQRQPFAWSFWFLVPDSLLRPVWLACLAILGLYTVGLFSRVTGVLAWVIIASTVRRV
ncbi:MAG: thiol-disulfide oxidoreductase, partial [Isosphaeraceae bacterium]